MLVLVVSALFWVFAIVGENGVLRQKELAHHRDRLREQLRRELAENDTLRAELEALKSDDLTIEEIVRDELDYQRPGEVVVMVDPKPPPPPPRPRIPVPPVPKEIMDRLQRQAAASRNTMSSANKSAQAAGVDPAGPALPRRPNPRQPSAALPGASAPASPSAK